MCVWVCVCACVRACVRACARERMYDVLYRSVSYTFEFIVFFVGECVWGGEVFPYGALCGLFCWNCALRHI